MGNWHRYVLAGLVGMTLISCRSTESPPSETLAESPDYGAQIICHPMSIVRALGLDRYVLFHETTEIKDGVVAQVRTFGRVLEVRNGLYGYEVEMEFLTKIQGEKPYEMRQVTKRLQVGGGADVDIRALSKSHLEINLFRPEDPICIQGMRVVDVDANIQGQTASCTEDGPWRLMRGLIRRIGLNVAAEEAARRAKEGKEKAEREIPVELPAKVSEGFRGKIAKIEPELQRVLSELFSYCPGQEWRCRSSPTSLSLLRVAGTRHVSFPDEGFDDLGTKIVVQASEEFLAAKANEILPKLLRDVTLADLVDQLPEDIPEELRRTIQETKLSIADTSVTTELQAGCFRANLNTQVTGWSVLQDVPIQLQLCLQQVPDQPGVLDLDVAIQLEKKDLLSRIFLEQVERKLNTLLQSALPETVVLPVYCQSGLPTYAPVHLRIIDGAVSITYDQRVLPQFGASFVPGVGKDMRGFLEVREVRPRSLADQLGLRSGDQIYAINDRSVSPVTDIQAELHQAKEQEGSRLRLAVLRPSTEETAVLEGAVP